MFDTHHYVCYNHYHPDYVQKSPEELLPEILETWKLRNIKPKFHISEQGDGKVGHHSDFVQVIPQYLLNIKKLYNLDIDIMIEAKKKEAAIKLLNDKYKLLEKYVEKNDELDTDSEDEIDDD